MKKTLLILLVVCVPIVLIAILVVDWHFPKIGEEARKPNKYDLLFYDTAVNNNDPSFCEKIYPEAYLTAAWSPSGVQAQYVKSECYLRIAISTVNPLLCDNVRPINTWFQDGSKINEQTCKEEVRMSPDAGRSYGTNSLTFVDLESLFFELGYTEDMIPQTYWDEYGNSSEMHKEFIFREYWHDVQITDDFKARVSNFLNSVK